MLILSGAHQNGMRGGAKSGKLDNNFFQKEKKINVFSCLAEVRKHVKPVGGPELKSRLRDTVPFDGFTGFTASVSTLSPLLNLKLSYCIQKYSYVGSNILYSM